MAIIKTPSTPTRQEILAGIVATDRQDINAAFGQVKNTLARVAFHIYGGLVPIPGTDPVTPQEAFSAWGTDGANLVQLSAAAVALLQAVTGTAPTLPPQGWSLAVNQDGTVTATHTQG